MREPAVLCGRDWFAACRRALDPMVRIDWTYAEGDDMAADSVVCSIAGSAPALLSAERTALNFLQMLSATATVTRRYAARSPRNGQSPRLPVLDTRKTLPRLRLAQKHAVRMGVANQRMAL